MIRKLLLFLLIFSGTLSFAQEYVQFYDTSAHSIHAFDRELIEERASEAEFDYEVEEIEQPNLIERFISWLLRKLFSNVQPRDVRNIYNVLVWIVGIIALVIFVFYLRKLQRTRLLNRNDVNLNQVQFLDFEGSEKDLDTAWKIAEEEENYTLAMRLLYIKCLHHLREKEIILWKKEKTNGDYLKELESRWEFTPLSRLSKLFAYSQYGGYTINAPEYLEAKELFMDVLAGKEGGSHEA